MVKLRNTLPLLGLVFSGAVRGVENSNNNIVPGAFIVEYEDGVDIDAELASVEPVADTRMKLDFQLFKGASVQFRDLDSANQQAAEMLNNTRAIKSMFPVRKYPVPKHTVHWTAGEDASAPEHKARHAPRQVNQDTWSPHEMTQVNRLRDQGIMGEGIKVAIVDTGIDYRHPALGGCFGPDADCLVTFGYDLVGDNYTGSNMPVPDPDPFDCGGHGSHVAGIVAAQTNNPYGIIGAATSVKLGAYRVFGCDGSAGTDVLIAAFNMAYEAGADIITASIGGASGWSEEPWAVAVSRIVANGVPCTVSAGNDGAQGLFYTSTAADGKGVTSIASIDNWLSPSLLVNATATTSGGNASSSTDGESFGFVPGEPANWANVTLPLFATSFDTTNPSDACDPLPASTPDLANYIVLIRRGTCAFVQKIQNAVDKGARYVLVYNNIEGSSLSIAATETGTFEAVAMVDAPQGAKWVSALAAGQNVTLAMNDPQTGPKFLTAPVNNVSGGYMSTYTSWAPTYEVDFKPQFGSPGGNILSTYPTAKGSYAVLSGTSMACPLVAGIYALLMEARGTKDPRFLENLLASTAKPNLFSNGSASFPVLAPAVQQGAGMVQVYDAAQVTTLLSVSGMSFNDTDNHVAEQEFTITNAGNVSVTYTLGHVGAAAGYTLSDNDTLYPMAFPNELLFDAATVSFSEESPLVIPAGERRIVTVTATPPPDLDARRIPVYSGYITINGSDSSALSLPYMGVASSLKSASVLGKEQTFMTRTMAGPNVTAASLAPGHSFLLPPPGRSNDTQFSPNITDYPQLQLSMAMGSAYVKIDVVPMSVPEGTNITKTLGDVDTVGDVFMTPYQWVTRNSMDAPTTTTWDGRLATGDYAPAGTYKMMVRALKIFGDRELIDDYETVETVEFSISYMSNATFAAKMRRRW